MVRIAGGRFRMGSDVHYPEEAPARDVIVDPFWIDSKPVTNGLFGQFVAETGYVTLAERAPDPAAYPGIRPEMIRPGSLLFTPPDRVVDLSDPFQWWAFRFGADWRHPYGPVTSIQGLEDHPVVHIAYQDALAFADWCGKELPTEAQWEFAARGGLNGAEFAWGGEFEPEGQPQANYWRGIFPTFRDARDFSRTSPVGSFPANCYGLYDMIGNVWEWTCDWYGERRPPSAKALGACCIPRDPRGGMEEDSFDPCTPDIRIGRRVLKGGSHLCAPDYCQRYRPAARYGQPVDTSASHVGFRCVRSDGP